MWTHGKKICDSDPAAKKTFSKPNTPPSIKLLAASVTKHIAKLVVGDELLHIFNMPVARDFKLVTALQQIVPCRYPDDSHVYLQSVPFPFAAQVHFLWLRPAEHSPGGPGEAGCSTRSFIPKPQQ